VIKLGSTDIHFRPSALYDPCLNAGVIP